MEIYSKLGFIYENNMDYFARTNWKLSFFGFHLNCNLNLKKRLTQLSVWRFATPIKALFFWPSL